MKLDVKSNIAQVLRRHDDVRRDVVDKAVPRALNRVADMAVTHTSKTMRAQGYAFKAGEIKAAIRVSKARAGLRTVVIRTRRNTKSLIDFSARETKAGVMVKVHGAAKLIKGAFIAQRQNGVTGVFVEDKSAGKIIIRRQRQYKRGSKGGWHAYPARKLYGPSVGGVSATPAIEQAVQAFIFETFSQRLQHEIRFLSR